MTDRKDDSTSRRGFVIGGIATVAGVAGGTAVYLLAKKNEKPQLTSPQPVLPPGDAIPPDQDAFPKRYGEALKILVEHIYPDEPNAPGASAAGAWAYIEREMRRSRSKGTRLALLRGAVQLDRVSMNKNKKVFARLTPKEQDDVIAAMLAGEGAENRFVPKDFIKLMIALTLEGTFCDPIYGGNKGEVGWKSINYVMQTPRPRAL